MQKAEKFRTLEEDLLLLQEEAKKSPLTIADILHILSGKGRSVVLILLSLPFCQPIQIPGLSMPFGFAIAFFGLRVAFGKHVWLPHSLLTRHVPTPTLESITHKTQVLMKKIKPWIHPRLTWMCQSALMEKVNGIIIFFLGIFLALPLPIPLSNLGAAWAICLVALGILEDDGVCVLLGYFVTLLTVAALTLMVLTIKVIV